MMWPYNGIVALAASLFLCSMAAARIWWLEHRDDDR